MTSFSPIQRAGADALCDALSELRGETLARCVAGRLSVCADDLLGAAGSVECWLADLETQLAAAEGETVDLPDREAWELRHVVYTVSAVLVWADCLRREGTLHTALPADALRAWAQVESEAGMPGRTERAMQLPCAGTQLVPPRPSSTVRLADARPRRTRQVMTVEASLAVTGR